MILKENFGKNQLKNDSPLQKAFIDGIGLLKVWNI
jgi:hypothetical protein